ncbi:MAG: phosphoglycerate dehydrogenase [Deltaproteobacteria bacterium]|nr:phosphoglycerate dehydrogenase [Deltaproteobacteria bacterium]
MDYHILVSDRVHQKAIDLFLSQPGFHVEVNTGLSVEALTDIIKSYDGLVIRSDTRVTAAIIAAAPKLRVIGRAGTGIDNVDVTAATRRGIVVMNTPGGNSGAAAELTLALIMAAHRHIPQAVASVKMGNWEKKRFQGREMAGKILGVIGLGKIGSLVGKRAGRGLRMNVLGYDPAITESAASQWGVKPASLEEIYRRSDVITVHTPLNSDTRGMVDSEAFRKMKDGVIIVNCARGGIVDEEALLEALDSGKVSAAALDDFTVKPTGVHPLVMHPRVISTPHLGASTSEAQINVAEAIAQQMIDYLQRGVVKNAVNVPGSDPADSARIAPYLDLAHRLAQFVGGLAPEGIVQMEVEYRGEFSAADLGILTNAALVGLLTRFEGTEVNHVNASVIAQDRGIRVLETTKKEGIERAASLRIQVTCSSGSCLSAHGALIKRVGDEPRIIGIDQFVTEAVPAGPMLIVSNRDIPGMVAGVSGALADRGINIAQMNLSRDREGGLAMSIINIDTPADSATLLAISQIQGILTAKQVILDS